MGPPLDFTFYNPDQLEDQSFLAGFIARQDLANKILARLGDIRPRGLAQHRLIVGQRGMGKTSLLRRIGLGVRDESALAAVLLPLSFREEQYNVHNLHVFWCNCLDALGDWFEAAGKGEQAERLDRDVAALNAQEDDEEGSKALELFRRWMKGEKRRPLLLLDNLDIIFAGLKSKQWSLRRVLQEPGGIVVIGASAAALEAAADREGAFYDFFQVDVLAKLEHHEILLCLRHMAQQREEAGRKVLQVLDRDPARIHVLYDLTGGNPRTLAMLYLVLETSGDEGVMRDLERLLDQATPLYKARVEELAPQTRVVFDALALAWNPVTAADLAGVTGLEVSVVSAQLDRMFKEGIVEKTSVSSSNRTAFQVAERFFNIWYLMRHSSRRQRLRLRWLTEMLRRIYSPRELRERATGLLGGGAGGRFGSAAYRLALSDAVEDRDLRAALRSSLGQYSSFAAEGYAPLEDDLSLSVVVHDSAHNAAATIPSYAAAEIYRRAIERNSDDAGLWKGLGKLLLDLPDFRVEAEAAFRRAIELDPKDAQPWNNLGWLLAKMPEGRHSEAETAYRKAIEIDPQSAWPWNNLGNLLMGPLKRHAEAEEALHKAIELDPKSALPWNNLGVLLKDLPQRLVEAEAAYLKAIAIDPQYALPWKNLGWLLENKLERHDEAENAYRKAIDIDPKDARLWNRLGILLAGPLKRYTEAEAAFRKAIEIDPKFARPWNNLGNLLADPMERHAEAEAAYRKAIDIDPKDALPWDNLGWLLTARLERHAEAETAYRNAIDIDPKDALRWNRLGILLAGPLKRYAEAEAAYRKAIEIAPKAAGPWNNLGNLLAGPLERHAEAEAAYRKAIDIDPKLALSWNNLGLLLAATLERQTEAETAYRKAINIDPEDAEPWGNLGWLLAGLLGRHAEAEAAYRKAIDINSKDAWLWNNLGNLLAESLGRHAEAEAAYRKAIDINPKDAWLWNNLGNLLAESLERHAEAEAAYRKAIETDPSEAWFWINLGNLLVDHLFRPAEAETVYRMALRIAPQEPGALVNLAYLLLRQIGIGTEAETIFRAAIAAMPLHGAGLLRTFHALAASNFGTATAELGSVLEEGHPELFTVFRPGLLRVLQFAAERGDGDKLLTWLSSSGLSDRYWPLHVAFDAYLHGEDRLMDVNPEVRSGARRLLAEMTPRPGGLPQPEPKKKTRRTRRAQ